jgi:hypothetical protein
MALVLLAQRWDLGEVAVAAELDQGLHVAQRAPHIVADAQRQNLKRTGRGEGNGEDGIQMRDVLRNDPDFAHCPLILERTLATFPEEMRSLPWLKGEIPLELSANYLAKFWWSLAWIEYMVLLTA